MKVLVHFLLIGLLCPMIYGSDPRGDDIKVGKIKAVTFDFVLPDELLRLAEKERERIKEQGRYGLTRTNPDGITVSLEVKDDLLYITGIFISGGDGGYAVNPTMIPTSIIKNPVIASSFSGEMHARYGRRLLMHIHQYSVKLVVAEGKIISKEHLKFTIDTKKKSSLYNTEEIRKNFQKADLIREMLKSEAAREILKSVDTK